MNEPEVIVKTALAALFGTSFTRGGVTFTFYDEPPLQPALPHVWSSITTLAEDGDKGEFRARVLIEMTVVAQADTNYPSKETVRLGGAEVLEKLVTRRQRDWAISINLSSTNQGQEEIGQKQIVFKKYNLTALIPCGPVFDGAELYRLELKKEGVAAESIDCVRQIFESLEAIPVA